ncbi:MAG TPA: HIT domain-containing protein [Oleiagrimonas sp.]|nr:HIT domain-containing protein [Oleiagrimonas sp.]
MSTAEDDFSLDPHLAADTVVLTDLPLCRLCLMNDSRFPWLILVPRRKGATEIDLLEPVDREMLWHEVDQAMGALRATAVLDKLNVGALGNIVRQLHVHVVARRETDVAWPGPVWGAGKPQAYAPQQLTDIRDRLRVALLRP